MYVHTIPISCNIIVSSPSNLHVLDLGHFHHLIFIFNLRNIYHLLHLRPCHSDLPQLVFHQSHFNNQTKAPSQSWEHSPASAQAPLRFDPHIGFVALSRSSAPSEWWAHGLVSPLGSLATREASTGRISCWNQGPMENQLPRLSICSSAYSTCGTSTSWQRLC